MTTRPGLTLTKRYSPALLVRASSVVPGTTTRASSSGRCDVLSVTLPAIDPVWALSATNGTASKANDESITRRTATRAIAFIAYSMWGGNEWTPAGAVIGPDHQSGKTLICVRFCAQQLRRGAIRKSTCLTSFEILGQPRTRHA